MKDELFIKVMDFSSLIKVKEEKIIKVKEECH